LWSLLLLYCFRFSYAKNITLEGDGWEYICVGNCETDVVTATIGGTIMQGGGDDVDDAYMWLIENSGGGDILTLRAFGTDVWNDIFFRLGSSKVNSVATLKFTKGEPACRDPIVLQKIRSCEALWFAGGDQWNYYHFWHDTPVQEAVNELIQKNVTVGGSSAGMAVMAGIPFVAEFESGTGEEDLNDPYNKNVSLRYDFLKSQFLLRTVTDTHFAERDRMGRIVTFVARVLQDTGAPAYGIACDEATAIMIPKSGIARVATGGTGNSEVDFPAFSAYFFVPTENPTVCKKDTPLTFQNLRVYRLTHGDQFDFNTWTSSSGHSYIIDATNGIMTTKGNNGHIY